MVAAIDIQDGKEIVIMTEATITKGEIENMSQDTSSDEELGIELLQANLQALQEEPSSLQEPLLLYRFENMIKRM